MDDASGVVDVDETEFNESLELPGADLSDQELAVRVLPRQADEFTCSKCFLVHHHSQLVGTTKDGGYLCRDCAACPDSVAVTRSVGRRRDHTPGGDDRRGME